MKFLLLLPVLCVAGALCGVSAQLLDGNAEDCVLYEGQQDLSQSHVKEFQQRVSVGVVPQANTLTGFELNLASTNHTCTILLVAGSIVASCTGETTKGRPRPYKWPVDIFSPEDVTEMWLEVGESPEDASLDSPSSSEVLLVGRRGWRRGHLVFSARGLTPPIRMRWKVLQPLNYYYNCLTGCVYSKSAKTQPGEHSVFLRQGAGPLLLSLTYITDIKGQIEANLTSDDLGSPGGLKNVTLVWNSLGTTPTGVLLDGTPVGDLTQYRRLNDNRGIEAKVEGGDALVTSCDPRFKGVADPPAAASPECSHGYLTGWQLVWLLLLVIASLAAAVVFGVLHYRDHEGVFNKTLTLSRFSSTRSTRSTKSIRSNRSSTKRKDPPEGKSLDVEDGGCEKTSGDADDDTVTTPADTPGTPNGPKSPRMISTRDLVDVELM